MKPRRVLYLNLLLIVALSLTTLSCSSSSGSGGKGNNLAELSGVWQDKECSCNVVIDLGGDTKTLSVNDQKFAVTVKSFANDKVLMTVKDDNGKTDDWEIIRVWDDNGSTFTLALIRNGKRESLSLIKKLT